MAAIPSIQMNSGTSIPQVGLGLWKVKDAQQCRDAVLWGLESGYTHFDSAQIYGNEEYLGDALQEAGVKRSDVFITTKIWNGNQPEDKLDKSFGDSLDRLETNYVDLLLLHYPVPDIRQSAWPIMEEIHRAGRAKAIGVSNYTVRHLQELLETCSVKPAVNQVEIHVYLQQPELVDFCKQNDILVEAYSPLAHANEMDNEALQRISIKHGKTAAQIMLRWCIEQGMVPLPKSVHKERLIENLAIFDFELDTDDHAEILKLDRNMRTAWDPSEEP